MWWRGKQGGGGSILKGGIRRTKERHSESTFPASERHSEVSARPMKYMCALFAVVNRPAAQVMLHQPSGGANGMAADIQIMAEEIIKTRARLNDIYAEHTGQVHT